MGESVRAFDRRNREGFFDKYMQGKGIDVGAGTDPVTWEADTWDLYESGMTQEASKIDRADETYDWVYSSHCLEHVPNREASLKEWWRILKHGGNLIISVPHRDLYEKKERPPSRWNMEHHVFFVPQKHLFSDVLGLQQLIQETLNVTNEDILYLKECSEGHTIIDPEIHSDGEISIEIVVRKQ